MSKVNSKKILIFGGNGFIGSHVAEKLFESNYNIYLFDLKKSHNLNKNFKTISGDILDENKVNRSVKGMDYVYNFAAISDLDQAITKPLETAKVNIIGNINILNACVKNKINKFIYASSVYAESAHGSFYQISKQASENYIKEYNKTYGINYTILRYGSLYGPRSDKTNGVWRIINDALKNNQISYQGNINSMREYIHVEDAALASVKMLESKFNQETVVLTGQESMKVIDFLEMIREIMNIKKKVKFKNEEFIGHYTRTPYSFKRPIAKKYAPEMHIDLGQGILDLIKNFKVK